MTVGPRHYHDPCGVARALNLIGERWALLIVRELLHGPKRFSDLRYGLPLVSPNVLSQRLAELVERHVVGRRLGGPPGRSPMYELTELGAALEPVLVSLATWGSRAVPPDRGELSTDALVLAMKTNVDETRACPTGDYELNFDGDRVTLHATARGLSASRAPSRNPIAVITATPAAIRQSIFGISPLDGLIAGGDLQLQGNQSAAREFLLMFKRPSANGDEPATRG